MLTKKEAVYDSLDDEELIFDDELSIDYFISPMNKVMLIKDFFIFMACIYTIFFIPFYLASNSSFYYTKKINFFNIYGIFNDCLFLADIFLGFFTAYYNKDDEFVQNNKKL